MPGSVTSLSWSGDLLVATASSAIRIFDTVIGEDGLSVREWPARRNRSGPHRLTACHCLGSTLATAQSHGAVQVREGLLVAWLMGQIYLVDPDARTLICTLEIARSTGDVRCPTALRLGQLSDGFAVAVTFTDGSYVAASVNV